MLSKLSGIVPPTQLDNEFDRFVVRKFHRKFLFLGHSQESLR
jgi:hypothetical protein